MTKDEPFCVLNFNAISLFWYGEISSKPWTRRHNFGKLIQWFNCSQQIFFIWIPGCNENPILHLALWITQPKSRIRTNFLSKHFWKSFLLICYSFLPKTICLVKNLFWKFRIGCWIRWARYILLMNSQFSKSKIFLLRRNCKFRFF